MESFFFCVMSSYLSYHWYWFLQGVRLVPSCLCTSHGPGAAAAVGQTVVVGPGGGDGIAFSSGVGRSQRWVRRTASGLQAAARPGTRPDQCSNQLAIGFGCGQEARHRRRRRLLIALAAARRAAGRPWPCPGGRRLASTSARPRLCAPPGMRPDLRACASVCARRECVLGG